MIYPGLRDYIDALELASENFKSEGRLELCRYASGEPVMTSGNFAVVFKMQHRDTGRSYALKCFIKEQDRRAESYRKIDEALYLVDSPYLAKFRYLEDELYVDCGNDAGEYPVVLMDWVEGESLDAYVRRLVAADDRYGLSVLSYKFNQLAMWLHGQPFAHGDVKPDNIMVHGAGNLVLVDYDGMYVPSMAGEAAREMGSPDYRHYGRTADDFNATIDDFSLVLLSVTLKALSLQPELLQQYGSVDALLFKAKDIRQPAKSTLMKELVNLFTDIELARLYSLLLMCWTEKKIPSGVLKMMQLTPPKRVSTRKYKNGDVVSFDVKGVKLEMVCVEGGSFMMGNEDGYDWEKPVHKVTLDGFWIGKTQVTQALWEAVMGDNSSYNKGTTHPVEQMSLDGCQFFIKRLNRLTGRRFALPTEAQWEFAARGGNLSKGYRYAGSNDIDAVAWYADTSGRHTHPVGEKQPNELGLSDRSGDVWERGQDW